MIHLYRYLYQAYKERYEASNQKDDMLEALACNTKYIRAQVSIFIAKNFDIYGSSRSQLQ
jgi:hypothetical protein